MRRWVGPEGDGVKMSVGERFKYGDYGTGK